MKLTRALSKFLARSWWEYNLNKIRIQLDYHRKMIHIFEKLEKKGTMN